MAFDGPVKLFDLVVLLREIAFPVLQVIEDHVNFELLLKVKRGIKEEIYRFEVNKNFIGWYCLSRVEQAYS